MANRTDTLIAAVQTVSVWLTTEQQTLLANASNEQPIVRHNGPYTYLHVPNVGAVNNETWNQAWDAWSAKWHPRLAAVALSRGWRWDSSWGENPALTTPRSA